MARRSAAWLAGADPETILKIYAAVNSKGGAGKSSMLIAFASALHHQGKRVRILDLDAQGTLARWLNPSSSLPSISRDELMVEAGQFVEKDEHGIDTGTARLAFARIREIKQKGGYDYLLIDTKGEPNMTAAAVMAAADLVLCPTDGSSTEYDPIWATYRSCRAALAQIGSKVDPQDKFRIVFTRQATVQSAGVLRGKQELAKHFQCIGGIGDSAAINDAHKLGMTIAGVMSYAEAASKNAETPKARANAQRMAERCARALNNASFVLAGIEQSEVAHVPA